MVIGIDAGIVAARFSDVPQRHVGDDFIGVHVGGGARTPLQHVDHEELMALARNDLVASRHDGVGNFGAECAELEIGKGRLPSSPWPAIAPVPDSD